MATESGIAQALALHRAGRLNEAEDLYRQILAAEPEHDEAMHGLGVVSLQKKDFLAGARLIRQSIDAGGSSPERLNDLGSAHWALGEFDEAEAAYRSALEMNPGLASAWSGLGGVLRSMGRHGPAADALKQSVLSGARQPRIRIQLAALLADLGDYDGAASAYRDALAIDPRSGPAARGLGQVLLKLGHATEAQAVCRQGLEANPQDPQLMTLLGEALQIHGLLDEAERAFRAALAIEPRHAWAWFNLGTTLIAAGRMDQEFLLRWLSFQGTVPAILRRAAIDYVKSLPASAELGLEPCIEGRDDRIDLDSEAARTLISDPVLRQLMRRAMIDDMDLESLLTRLRGAILLSAGRAETELRAHEEMLDFLCALAELCFGNEFVFWQSPEETAAVERLRISLERAIAEGGSPAPHELAMFAAYRPLYRLAGSKALLGRSGSPGEAVLQRLIVQQVQEPLQERALAKEIPALTGIADSTSKAVRSQYEENPYPRWREVDRLDTRPMELVLTGLFPHLRRVHVDWPRAPRVLIAGCGTGHQPVSSAQRFEGCTVKAIDLSRASIAYARRKTEEAGIRNIEYLQGDILELRRAEDRFDIIECTGVLHHMADPLEGWRVLSGLLAPGGFMKIGLYSERGRRSIVAARELVAAEGLSSRPDGIRQGRRMIHRLPEGHPARQVMERPDFYAMSSCRDLIFHVQEHRLTIPRIAEWLELLGLEFLGFELAASGIARDYRSRFPGDPDLRSLENWDQFEQDHRGAFAGMYLFWVRGPAQAVDPGAGPKTESA